MHSEELIATPINLGSSELVSINDLVTIVEEIAGVKLERPLRARRAQGRRRPQQRQHLHQAGPRLGANGRRFATGMATTYAWIAEQYAARKAGQAVVGGLTQMRAAHGTLGCGRDRPAGRSPARDAAA